MATYPHLIIVKEWKELKSFISDGV